MKRPPSMQNHLWVTTDEDSEWEWGKSFCASGLMVRVGDIVSSRLLVVGLDCAWWVRDLGSHRVRVE